MYITLRNKLISFLLIPEMYNFKAKNSHLNKLFDILVTIFDSNTRNADDMMNFDMFQRLLCFSFLFSGSELSNKYHTLVERYMEGIKENDTVKVFQTIFTFNNKINVYSTLLEIFYSKGYKSINDEKIKKKYINESKNVIKFFMNKYYNQEKNEEYKEKLNMIFALIMSMILEEIKHQEFTESTKQKSLTPLSLFKSPSKEASKEDSLNSIENIIETLYTVPFSIILFKGMFYELFDIEKEKKLVLIQSKEIKCTDLRVKDINNEILSFITKFISKCKCSKTDLDIVFNGMFKYMSRIQWLYDEYFRKPQPTKGKKVEIDNSIICMYYHLFDSEGIFSLLLQKYYNECSDGENKTEISSIIEHLLRNHEHPFIFNLIINLGSKRIKGIDFLLSFITNYLHSEIQMNSLDNKNIKLFPNIVNLLITFYKLIVIQKIQLTDEIVKCINTLFNNIIIDSLLCYLRNLFPIGKNVKKSILEMMIDIRIQSAPNLLETLIVTAFNADTLNNDLKYKEKKISDKKIEKFNNTNENENKSFLIMFIQKIKATPSIEIGIKENLLKLLGNTVFDLLSKCKHQCPIKNDDNKYAKISLLINQMVKAKNKDKLIEELLSEDLLSGIQNENTIVESPSVENINISNRINNCPLGDECRYKNISRKSSTESKRRTPMEITKEKIISEEKKKETIYNLFDINTKDVVICAKRDLLLKKFGVFFKDVYFNNKNFIKMRRLFDYLYTINGTENESIYEPNFKVSFPTTMKNFSSCKLFYPKLFFKQNLNFFKNKYFPISHPYYIDKVEQYKDEKPSLSHSLLINEKNGLLFCDVGKNSFECECELLSNTLIVFGKLIISQGYILFVNKNKPTEINEHYLFGSDEVEDTEHKKQVLIPFIHLEEAIMRRFLYMNQAIEFFTKNGKSYFFNLYTEDTAQVLFDQLEKVKKEDNNKEIDFTVIREPKKYFIEKNFTSDWKTEKIDNLQYLLIINKFAGRTYNDSNQYPVLPWITLINKNENGIPFTIRNFKYPISVQSPELRKEAQSSYENSKEDTKYPCHFRLHYSTWAYVILYLARLSPFTENQIKLQNGKFENPNRQFSSFSELFDILESNFDNRELIPEMYMFCEYFYNINKSDFGFRSADKLLVNNIFKPPGFPTPFEFVLKSRMLFNSERIIKKINLWINNVFGYYQNVKEESRCNMYSKYCYSDNVHLLDKKKKYEKNELSMEDIFMKFKAKKIRILSFGQTPLKLFDQEQKEWTLEEQVTQYSKDEMYSVSNVLHEGGTQTYKYDESVQIVYFNYTTDKNKIFLLKKVKSNQKKTHLNTPNLYYELDVRELSDLNHSTTIRLNKIKIFKKTVVASIALQKGMKLNEVSQTNSSINSQGDLEKTNFVFYFHPKYTLFDLYDGEFFVTARNYNNTIIIYSTQKDKKIIKTIITGSFVSSVYPISTTRFISGHKNGKLIEWEIIFEEVELKRKKKEKRLKYVKPIRDILAHENCFVISILYIQTHNLLVTSGEDGNVYIRKYYDFELINVIALNKSIGICKEIFFSNNDVFYLSLINKDKATNLASYTINGIQMICRKNHWSSLFMTKKGLLLGSTGKSNKIEILEGYNLNRRKYNYEEIQKEKAKDKELSIEQFLYNENDEKYLVYIAKNVIYKNTNDKRKERLIPFIEPYNEGEDPLK